MRFFIAAIAICLLASPLNLATPLYGQQVFDPAKDLSGRWELDYVKTRELWNTPELKEMALDISMIPIAAEALSFSSTHLSFEITGLKSSYTIQSYDTEAKLLTLITEYKKRNSIIQFTVPDENTLVLDLPASFLGPIQVAYTRKAAEAGVAKVDSPLKEVAGRWFVDETATKLWWKQIATPSQLANYKTTGEQAIRDASEIKISDFEITYADQTFAPWKVMSVDNGVFTLGQFGQPEFEIQVVSENLLQLADKNRRLIAIYKRQKDTLVDVESFSKGRLATEIVKYFAPIEPRPALNGYKGVIAKSGTVEIDAIEIQRKRASFSAVKADITNLKLQLFVGLPDKHEGFFDQRQMIKLTRLDDIYDDRGTLLLTENRKRRIEYLKHPVASRTRMNRRSGINGPAFSLVLDAPAIGASKLKKISGVVEVTQVSKKLLRFTGIGDLQNQKLTHPLLGSYQFKIRIDNGKYPEFVLRGTEAGHSKVGDWYLTDIAGNRLKSNSIGRGGGEQTKGYLEAIPNKANLVLTVYDQSPAKIFPFSFENISIQ